MLKDDIKFAKNIIEGKKSNVFDQMYSFTNENIKGCFKHFDFEGKNILSVLSSSDQVFDMFLRGTKNIDTFDINPLTKYYFHLKKAAILALDVHNFTNFFSYSDSKYFDKDIFREIAKYLKEDSYIFWKTLFDYYDVYEIDELFISSETHSDTPYLSDYKKYKLLQTKIDLLDVRFINCDIYDLVDILNTKYDIIYLSNILGRLGFKPLHYKWENGKILEKILPFLQKLSEFLKDDGKIIANYLYIYSQITRILKTIENNGFDASHFEKIKFKRNEYRYGGALIYRK